MLCPVCKTELKITGLERMETLLEHVCCPNAEIVSEKPKYECPNTDCSTCNVVFWDRDGGLYSYPGKYKEKQDIKYIDNNDGPFGSLERKINVEVSKKDENKYLYEGKKIKIELVYQYLSNENGDILKRKRSYKIWKKNKDNDLMWTLYISGISMLIYSIKKFHRDLKLFKKGYINSKDIVTHKTLVNWHKKDWWRRVAKRYASFVLLFYKKRLEMV